MKLLIVVGKLLTGFDARAVPTYTLTTSCAITACFKPSAVPTDFDGEDKDYGYVVDFKEQFMDVQQAIAVYSSDKLAIDESGADDNIYVENWLEEGKRRHQDAREALHYLCDPVPQPPEKSEQFLRYFCGDAADPDALNRTEPLQVQFYKTVATLVRAFAAIAQDLVEAGYYSKRCGEVADGGRVLRGRYTAARSNSTPEKSSMSNRTKPICVTFSTPMCKLTRRRSWASLTTCLLRADYCHRRS